MVKNLCLITFNCFDRVIMVIILPTKRTKRMYLSQANGHMRTRCAERSPAKHRVQKDNLRHASKSQPFVRRTSSKRMTDHKKTNDRPPLSPRVSHLEYRHPPQLLDNVALNNRMSVFHHDDISDNPKHGLTN